MSSIRERLGLQSNGESDIRKRLGLANYTPEPAKTEAPKFASRNEKTDNLSSQRNFAAEKLEASRKKYQDYLKEETKESKSLKVSPLSSKTSLDLTARNQEMATIAQKQSQELEKAVKSQKGQELKQDIREKQSEYNYANYLKNLEDVENADYNWFNYAVNPILSGAADILQIDKLDPESQYYYDEEGNKSYLPTKRSLKQQKIRETSSGVGKIYNDVAYNMSKAVTSKVMDIVAPGSGTIAYYGDVFLDSTEEAKKQGYNGTEAVTYAAGVTVLARVLDDFIGTFGGLSNTSDKIPTLSSGLDKFFGKITSSPVASTILSNMTSEAISEFAEEYADNALKYIINSDQSGYDSFVDMLGQTLPDALYSGLVGSISGGVGGTIENIKNDVDIQVRKNAVQDYITTLENYNPQTVEEANYKEDQINMAENQLTELEQQETNIVQQQETTEEVAPQQETVTMEEQPEQPTEITKETTPIKMSEEPKKQGQLQLDIKEQQNQEIATKGKELGMSDKEITYKQLQIEGLEDNKITKDTSMDKAIATGNVEITKDGGYKKTLNEKVTNQVISLLTPTKDKVTVETEDVYGNKVKAKKPSNKSLANAKTNGDIVDTLENTKTASQKAQDRNDELKTERTYARRKEKIDDDARLTDYEKTEMEHMFKALSLDELEQKWADAVLDDIDGVDEKLRVEVLNKNITPDTIAKAAVLCKYYDQQGDFVKADEYYQLASTALHDPARTLVTAKLLYQDNPMGAYMSYMRAIENLYKHDAKYHKNDVAWHEKNDLFNSDGSINKNSRYWLSDDLKNELGAKIREWYKIENPASKEAKVKKMEIDTLLNDNLPDKPRIEKLLDFRRSAMLNSIGIWVKNSRQEIIDLTVGIATDIGSSPSDRYLQKIRNQIENEIRQQEGQATKQKRYRTTSFLTTSGKEFVNGYKDGIKNHWESIKNDVVLNRYSDLTMSTNDRVSATSEIRRKSDNKLQAFVDKANAFGMGADERFREAYFATALYDQQAQFALNMAANQNQKAVVRTELSAAGADITFADPDTLTLQHEIIPDIKTNDDLLSYLDKNYIAPSEKDVNNMLDRASQIGNYRTMQDSGALTRFTNKMIKTIDDFTIEHLHFPLGSTIAPFYRASTESLRTLYKSTPLAAIDINNKIKAFKKAVRDNATGANTTNNLFDMQYSLAKDIGQAVGGTMALVIGSAIVKALADKDMIVGNKSDEKKDEKEYTLKVGDKSYSFNIDTVTTNGLKFLSILTDKDNVSQKEGESIIKNIENTIFNFGNPMLDMVLEQTALSAFAEYGESKFRGRGENIAYQISRIPASFVPTISKNIASIIDGFTARDTSSDTMFGKMINAIGSKIPVVRSMYNEKKDKWNSTEEAGLNILEKAWNSLVTNDISVSKTTPIDKELYDVYLSTGSTDAFPSTGLSNEFTRGTGDNKAKYTLSKAEQKKYQQTYGEKAFDTLQSLMTTTAYKSANNKDRLTMIRAAYNYAKTYAQNEYLDSKDVYYETEETAIERVINQNISYTSAQYQKENPNRWKLYTSIVPDYDDYKEISNKIKNITDTYSSKNGFNYSTRRNMVVDYVNGLNNLSATKKAMLIKISGFQSSYGSYDSAIYKYLDTLNLTEDEYNYFIKESNLGLKGYYTTIRRNK